MTLKEEWEDLLKRTFIDEWKTIVKKAWSIRFIVAAFVMSSGEALLPYFYDDFPRGIFAGLTVFFTGGAFVARLMAQQGVNDAAKD